MQGLHSQTVVPGARGYILMPGFEQPIMSHFFIAHNALTLNGGLQD